VYYRKSSNHAKEYMNAKIRGVERGPDLAKAFTAGSVDATMGYDDLGTEASRRLAEK
jgi:hypothetical protein